MQASSYNWWQWGWSEKIRREETVKSMRRGKLVWEILSGTPSQEARRQIVGPWVISNLLDESPLKQPGKQTPTNQKVPESPRLPEGSNTSHNYLNYTKKHHQSALNSSWDWDMFGSLQLPWNPQLIAVQVYCSYFINLLIVNPSFYMKEIFCAVSVKLWECFSLIITQRYTEIFCAYRLYHYSSTIPFDNTSPVTFVPLLCTICRWENWGLDRRIHKTRQCFSYLLMQQTTPNLNSLETSAIFF